ncbi:hypothetical protein [Ottowia sp.]|uniref:hypothetical protein n=1 Tax=Ottowia sp. TaxID=1898956 RepID=UPI0039E3C125
MTTATTPTLQGIALDVVAKYNAAGKHLVGAWSAGTLRLVNGAAARTPAAPAFIGEKLGQQLSDANQAVNSFVVNAVKKNAEQTVKLMDLVADRATKNIETLAAAAERVQDKPGSTLVNAWNSLQLPAARISLRIADAIANGAEKLEARVAGAAESSDAATTVRVKSPRARGASRKA